MNFGESRTVTLSEMIRVVGEVFERDPVVEEHSLQPGDALRTYADTSKARRLLGYDPTTDFEDGMRRFAQWYLAEGAREDGVG